MKNYVKRAPPPKIAYSVDEACSTVGIGRDKFYSEMKAGRGPRTFKIGNRRLVRAEALAAWLAELENAQNL